MSSGLKLSGRRVSFPSSLHPQFSSPHPAGSRKWVEKRERGTFRGIKETLRGVQNRETSIYIYIHTCTRVALHSTSGLLLFFVIIPPVAPSGGVPLSNSLITPREFDKNLNSIRDTGCSGSKSTIRSPCEKLFHNWGFFDWVSQMWTGLFDFS